MYLDQNLNKPSTSGECNDFNISQRKHKRKKSQKRKQSGRKYSHKKRYSGKKHKKGPKGKYSEKKGKGKYFRKNKSKNRRRFRKGKKMTGGAGCQYERLGEGQQGVFTADMSQRTFEGKQPNWQPSDV